MDDIVIEENNLEKEEINLKKKNNLVFFSMIIVIGIIVLLVLNFVFSSVFSSSDINSDIRKVKKILNEKYKDIYCIDSSCKYLVAVKGDLLKKVNYQIFNLNGKRISSFYVDNSKNETTILSATEKYVVIKEVEKGKTKYILKSRTGRKLYSTEDNIVPLNENYLIVNKNDKYSIITTKGSKKYTNISKYDSFSNGNYVSVKSKNRHYIVDVKGNKVLENYQIIEEVKLNNELLYLIVKSDKNGLNYYFNIQNNKIIGDGFNSYSKIDNKGKITISKTEKNKVVKYVLDKNGNQEKLALSEDQNQIKEVIKSKVDKDMYYVYSYGLKDPNQNVILVDNKSDNSFGVLNVKNGNYKKLYSYKSDNKSVYSLITELKSNNNYVQINCSKANCDENKTYIYDLENDKEIYSVSENEKIISNYVEFDGYKMIQYSRKSTDPEISGKYILYNNDNKKIYESDNYIYVVDKKLKFGNVPISYIMLFNSKQNKTINDSKSLATKLNLGDEYVFNFTTNNNNVIYTETGKEVLKIKPSDYITYSNSNIIYIHDSKLYVYNANKDRTRTYKMRPNEKLNSESSKIITPYRGTIFINNTINNEMKIVNSKARVMRKAKGVSISSVKINKEDGTAIIIVKKAEKTEDKYGVYFAK